MKCKAREILNKIDSNFEKCIQHAILIDTNYCDCALCFLDKKERLKINKQSDQLQEIIDNFSENKEELMDLISLKRCNELKDILKSQGIFEYIFLDKDFYKFEEEFKLFLENYKENNEL